MQRLEQPGQRLAGSLSRGASSYRSRVPPVAKGAACLPARDEEDRPGREGDAPETGRAGPATAATGSQEALILGQEVDQEQALGHDYHHRGRVSERLPTCGR